MKGKGKSKMKHHELKSERMEHEYNKGGEVKKKKEHHKAEGHKEKERRDKKPRLATGGKVATPKSPLTGAMPKGLPGGGKGVNRPVDRECD